MRAVQERKDAGVCSDLGHTFMNDLDNPLKLFLVECLDSLAQIFLLLKGPMSSSKNLALRRNLFLHRSFQVCPFLRCLGGHRRS